MMYFSFKAYFQKFRRFPFLVNYLKYALNNLEKEVQKLEAILNLHEKENSELKIASCLCRLWQILSIEVT